jgi:hypothetical protein
VDGLEAGVYVVLRNFARRAIRDREDKTILMVAFIKRPQRNRALLRRIPELKASNFPPIERIELPVGRKIETERKLP